MEASTTESLIMSDTDTTANDVEYLSMCLLATRCACTYLRNDYRNLLPIFESSCLFFVVDVK